jgi:hypothetical protein
MKRSIWVTAAGFLALSTIATPVSRAADHRDGPSATGDPQSDITDVYAWMSADGNQVYLALDVQGSNLGATSTTQFSNAAQYVIHVSSGASYAAGTAAHADTIVCKFDTAAQQGFECWGPGASGAAAEYVKDTVGNATGKASTSGKMKVFAGVRNDPFYFNIRGFAQVGATVKGAAGGLAFDVAGCPTINTATKTELVAQLNHSGGTGTTRVAPTDDFGKNGLSPLPPGTGGMTTGNILAIVVAIDKTLLTSGGSLLSVWASTNK